MGGIARGPLVGDGGWGSSLRCTIKKCAVGLHHAMVQRGGKRIRTRWPKALERLQPSTKIFKSKFGKDYRLIDIRWNPDNNDKLPK